MDERKNSYARNFIPSMEIDKDACHIMQGREKSSTLYSKRKDEQTTLDDFLVMKVIGQGSFGKVFMVQHKPNSKYFAMKSIRKDVVIDAE